MGTFPVSRTYRLTSASPEQTRFIGQLVGSILAAGDCLALSGPLGAGKTQFVKGLAAGLGVPDDEPVTSPSFVLVREYAGRLRLFHVDAYRLGGSAELWSLGLEEILEEPDAVVAIEWADRVAEAVPRQACWIGFEHAGVNARRITFRWEVPGRLTGLRARLRNA